VKNPQSETASVNSKYAMLNVAFRMRNPMNVLLELSLRCVCPGVFVTTPVVAAYSMR